MSFRNVMCNTRYYQSYVLFKGYTDSNNGRVYVVHTQDQVHYLASLATTLQSLSISPVWIPTMVSYIAFAIGPIPSGPVGMWISRPS